MVVLFGTSASKNDLHDDDEYAHVSVEKPLAPVTFELIEFVQSLAAETKGVPADCILRYFVILDFHAIVAIQLLFVVRLINQFLNTLQIIINNLMIPWLFIRC